MRLFWIIFPTINTSLNEPLEFFYEQGYSTNKNNVIKLKMTTNLKDNYFYLEVIFKNNLSAVHIEEKLYNMNIYFFSIS